MISMKKISRRETMQRKIILEELMKVKTHPNANEVYGLVKRKIPSISFATVYRNLKLLRDAGKIIELDGGRFRRYDGNPENHYHFSCTKCNKMFDIKENVDSKIDKKISRLTAFKVFYHNTVFFGLCKRCR